MANIIKPKRSSVAGKVPTNTDIVNGEIAINSTDQKIYTNAGGTVTQVGAGVLDALGDVVLTSPTSGQSLAYNGTNWVNSAAGSGTVTSVGITASTGITVSGSPITTSGNITVGVSTKLAEIENLSGAGFFTQNGSGVIAARTIQAGTGISVAHGNGSSQDPTITNTGVTSAVAGTGITVSNATGAVTITATNNGTVTSVGMTVPTGLTIAGSPITTSGTLALTFTAGYSIPTTASQTNWDTAYSDRLKWDGGSTGLVAATGRTSLGLGTIATQNSNAVSITGGTITGITDLAVADGGTGSSTAAGARTNLGATTLGGNLFTITNPGAITFPRFNADNTVSALSAADFRTAIGAGTGSGTVTSVTGTSPVASSGGTTPAISLASGYGDTQNPYASKTAKYVLAAPNAAAGVPTFRALVASDIPTLNQNTTGSAATLTTGRTIAITGDLAYTSGSFNGSANVTGTGTLATVNSNVGSFTNASITVDAKGRVTAASTGSGGATKAQAMGLILTFGDNMAAPNIANLTTITGKTAVANLTTTSATSVLSNAASSGKALKVNSLYVSNVNGTSPYTITINYYSAAALGGTATQIASTIVVPADATLVVIDKDSYIYLEEDRSLGAIASSANQLKVVVSYEEMS